MPDDGDRTDHAPIDPGFTAIVSPIADGVIAIDKKLRAAGCGRLDSFLIDITGAVRFEKKGDEYIVYFDTDEKGTRAARIFSQFTGLPTPPTL